MLCCVSLFHFLAMSSLAQLPTLLDMYTYRISMQALAMINRRKPLLSVCPPVLNWYLDFILHHPRPRLARQKVLRPLSR